MSVFAYVGRQGGGKSLSCIEDYLLPQLRADRHIFSNIIGLDPMRVAARLNKGLSENADRFTTSRVEKFLHRYSLALLDDQAVETQKFVKELDDGSVLYSCMQGFVIFLNEIVKYKEAVLIMDECHEHLNPLNFKELEPFKKYLSMTRHYGHDAILITQNISDIWQPLQHRVHETHEFTRGGFGLRKQYVEKSWRGVNMLILPDTTTIRFDDKSLYKLYKSHDKGAKERLSYFSIWKSKKFVAALFAVVLLFTFSIKNLMGGVFGGFKKSRSEVSAPVANVPDYKTFNNVVYVKYVVCNAYNCLATRPDGTTITLPLDYASGKYPVEVKKYVPSSSFAPGLPGMGSK